MTPNPGEDEMDSARELSTESRGVGAGAFTPGPWVQDEACICSQYGTPVAQTCRQDEFWTTSDDDMPAAEIARIAANARLIAAAPDGYALAETILRLAYVEELSTHVEVSFEPHDAALLLQLAGKLVSKALGHD